MAKLYYATNELGDGILNPRERGFRSLDKALALAAGAALDCSWECRTPPAPDNEVNRGRGNFRCGVTAAHGIHVQAAEDNRWGEEYDVPDEIFQKAKRTDRADWAMEVVIDRGTGPVGEVADTHYFTGPEPSGSGWDQVLENIADGDEIVEAAVTPLASGRYWHLAGEEGYPLGWERGRGF